MSEFEKFFEIKFPNIQATIDQSHCDESILLKKACRMTWNARQSEIDQLKAEKDAMTEALLNQVQIIVEKDAEIEKLKAEKAGVQKRFNFLLDKNICNESDHASLKLRVAGLLSKWKKDSEHADSVASEDFVQNVLDACIDDLEKTLRGEHE